MLGAVLAGSHTMRGNSVRYKLGCSLSYEIGSAATFIFNLEIARPISQIPLAIFPFLLPSRYVPSDRLAGFARTEFGSLLPGHERVNAVCGWIYNHLEYRPGSSSEETTADETLLKRAGICRDFSHLAIAFCRGLGIPARFVSCYAYGLVPPDFHAVFEAYLDGR
jgi:transglutaminase-like putative cysteine protease